MNNLPNELLVKILKCLNDSDLDNSVNVSDYWQNVIYDTIGVMRFIGQTQNTLIHLETIPLAKLIEVEAIGEIGMHYCLICDIPDQREIPKYRNPHLIKKMSFIGSIGKADYEKLVTPLYNLTCLSFLLKTLENFTFSTGLEFPKLKQFKLLGLENLANTNNLDNENLWSNILMIFLNTQFPQLEVIQFVGLPLLSPNDGKTLLDAFIVFLDKHKTTLKDLGAFVVNKFVDGKTIPEIPRIQNTIQLKLNSFHVLYTPTTPNYLQVTEELNKIVKNQTTLKSYVGVLPIFDPILIQQNSNTLVTIDLNTHFTPTPDLIMVIDFAIFENCLALKHLSIIGQGGIMNTKSLPSSLESIRLEDFDIDSNEASDLLTKKWTNTLNRLRLWDFGTVDNFGIPFDAVCTLLRQKSIQKVWIKHGMNRKSLADAKNLSPREKSNFPDLAKHILDRKENEDIKFALDLDKNYVFMDWDQIDGIIYSPFRCFQQIFFEEE